MAIKPYKPKMEKETKLPKGKKPKVGKAPIKPSKKTKLPG
jgi:hypothetical protein